MKRRKYDLRFLLLGVGLTVLIFVVTLIVDPPLNKGVSAVFSALVGAITAAFGFVATLRQALEKNHEQSEDDGIVSPDEPGKNIKAVRKTHQAGNGSTRAVEVGAGNQFDEDGLIGMEKIPASIIVEREPSPEDIQKMREYYLNSLFGTYDILSLAGIDPVAANEKEANFDLSAVYTALLTRNIAEPDRSTKIERREAIKRATQPASAVEMLNRYNRLVLLGDPGSGKSTFVSFVFICMAGEILNHPEVNLKLLRQPLPEEAQRAIQKNQPPDLQSWDHGPLLPVRIVLRDLAARGLLKAGESAGVGTLLDFLQNELEILGADNYITYLVRELQDVGGLVMFDGLDEVPEADQRRVQIKQIVEGFANAFPRCRVLVTSRPYAYQKQEWRLTRFTETTLEPFSTAQIEHFIDHWYEQVALKRKLNPDDARGKAAELKEAALKSERLRGLAERPLLLTLMASLHSWRGGTLPEKREQLYSDAVELLLYWWETQRVVRGPTGEPLLAPISVSLVELLKIRDRLQVRGLLNRLAFEAHKRQTDRNESTGDVPETDLITGLVDLSEIKTVDVRELRDYLSQRAGLLLPKGVGVYTFPHRTFQEYLAACYLTDHDFPETLADLANSDYERWREVALLAGAKAARGTASAIWLLVDALCYSDITDGKCGEQDKLWSAHLAGQALVESADLTQLSERNQSRLERVRSWLGNIVEQGELPAGERAIAGDNLARLGDPRFDSDLFHLPCTQRSGFVKIAEGFFHMGRSPDDPYALREEQELRVVELDTYYLARYPTTTAQFNDFVKASGYQPANPECLRGVANHPVVWVTWKDALAYCEWLDGELRKSEHTPPDLRELLEAGFQVSLPTEAEWEKAARGNTLNIFPWGDQPDAKYANTRENGIGKTSPVGCFPLGASPCELLDMSGNVWEWTRSLSNIYPDVFKKGLEVQRTKGNRILKGGSWSLGQEEARCASGVLQPVTYLKSDVGFRIVLTRLT